MGDRYELDLLCSYCNSLNKDVWYAPTSSSDTFTCRHCGKDNFITQNFKSKKIKDVTLQDVKEGFEMTTMLIRSEKETNKMCEERLNQIKGGLNEV